MIKKIALIALLAIGSTLTSKAQIAESDKTVGAVSEIKFSKLDASPLDVVYYPLNTTKSKEPVEPVMRVLYSRPQKKGREIFGVLEQFDKVWRLGANENTEIQFFKPVTIAGKKIKAGRYSLFAIPSKEKWIIIINKQVDKWGAFSYDEKSDVTRVEVPVNKLEKTLEIFSITFADTPEGANLIMAWDNTQTALPIGFKK